MNFNNILKKSMEMGKDFKSSLTGSGSQYSKEFWDFVLKISKNGENETEFQNNMFICQKTAAHSFENGYYSLTSIIPTGTDIKISFAKEEGKEFSFEAGNFRFTYNWKHFIFTKGINENLSEQLFITNSTEIIDNFISLGVKKVKFVVTDSGAITDVLFTEFLVAPKTFEKEIEKFWEELSEPFKIFFGENYYSEQELAIKSVLLKLRNENSKKEEPLKEDFIEEVQEAEISSENSEKNEEENLLTNVADKVKNIFKK